MGRTKSSHVDVRLKKRRDRVMQLRIKGVNLKTIAKTIADDAEYDSPNYDISLAHRDIMAALKELNASCSLSTEEYRRMELERLDQMQLAVQPQLKVGSLKAIDTALRICERRSKLLGLDAPFVMRVEETVSAELQQFMVNLRGLLPTAIYQQVVDATMMMGEQVKAIVGNGEVIDIEAE
jgi:hypothetical protein